MNRTNRASGLRIPNTLVASQVRTPGTTMNRTMNSGMKIIIGLNDNTFPGVV